MRAAFAYSFVADQVDDSLTMNERAVLVYMCSVAHDGDQPPRYWGGRDAIARYALGRVVPEDDGTAETTKVRRSIFESLRQALSGLARRDVIELVGKAYPGRNQEYLIAVDNSLALATEEQAQLGSSASTAWVKNKESLQMTQAHIGPETLLNPDTNKTPRSPTRAPHFRPVDNSQSAEVRDRFKEIA